MQVSNGAIITCQGLHGTLVLGPRPCSRALTQCSSRHNAVCPVQIVLAKAQFVPAGDSSWYEQGRQLLSRRVLSAFQQQQTALGSGHFKLSGPGAAVRGHMRWNYQEQRPDRIGCNSQLPPRRVRSTPPTTPKELHSKSQSLDLRHWSAFSVPPLRCC